MGNKSSYQLIDNPLTCTILNSKVNAWGGGGGGDAYIPRQNMIVIIFYVIIQADSVRLVQQIIQANNKILLALFEGNTPVTNWCIIPTMDQ